MKVKQTLAAGVIAALGLVMIPQGEASALNKPDRSQCQALEDGLLARGVSPAMAQYLAHRIAWRESGCVLQCVNDLTSRTMRRNKRTGRWYDADGNDDVSCSRFGINMIGRMPHHWGPLCDAWSVYNTSYLDKDLDCAAAEAKSRRGLRAWGGWR